MRLLVPFRASGAWSIGLIRPTGHQRRRELVGPRTPGVDSPPGGAAQRPRPLRASRTLRGAGDTRHSSRLCRVADTASSRSSATRPTCPKKRRRVAKTELLTIRECEGSTPKRPRSRVAAPLGRDDDRIQNGLPFGHQLRRPLSESVSSGFSALSRSPLRHGPRAGVTDDLSRRGLASPAHQGGEVQRRRLARVDQSSGLEGTRGPSAPRSSRRALGPRPSGRTGGVGRRSGRRVAVARTRERRVAGHRGLDRYLLPLLAVP